jgi:subtilisin family serine protease
MSYLSESDVSAVRKLDAPLRRLLTGDPELLEEAARRRIARVAGTRPEREAVYTPIGPIVVERRSFLRARRTVLVRFHGNRSDLESLGLQVRSQAQDVFTVSGTLDALADLARQPAALSIELPRPAEPSVENAAGQAEIDQIHQPRPANPAGYEGDDVIVGIIDWPLDVTHYTIRDAGGTRVLFMWVPLPSTLGPTGNIVYAASPPGQTPDAYTAANPTTTPNFTGLTYGRIYDKAAIDAALGNAAGVYGTGASQICCTPRLAEHGTHVAGIAAGDGDGAAGPTAHVGAAPQADIVYVGAMRWDSTQICDAIRFILAVADDLGRPVVINMSMGSNWDGHTGESAQCQFMDNQLNSFDERVMVAAAGNDNDDLGMRTAVISAGATDSFTMTSTNGATPRDIAVSVWTGDAELEVRLGIGGSFCPWQSAGSEWSGVLSGFDASVDRRTEGTQWFGLNLWQEQAVSGSPTTIELRNPSGGDVTYVAWSCAQGQYANLSGATAQPDRLTLADIATARSLISVGSCDGLAAVNPSQGETISTFSGAGPTLDGRVKPEIVAVGGSVRSANSDQASGWTWKGGTSMASPLVAGAVACLLQEARGNGQLLNHDSVRGLLTRHANDVGIHVAPADPAFNVADRNRYGYGRLRMIGPIDQIAPPVEVDLWIRTADDDFGHEPFIGDVFWTSPDIRVLDPATGAEITTVTWDAEVQVRVRVRNLGSSNAVGATVRLYYTLPWAAPNAWYPAEDATDTAQVATLDVPAIDEVEHVFRWRPQRSEIPTTITTDHYCLLATVDHALDGVQFAGGAAVSGGDAWSLNIRGSNNVALRNVHIQ